MEVAERPVDEARMARYREQTHDGTLIITEEDDLYDLYGFETLGIAV